MGDYFKPWRRKIGVVTLVMSCVTTAAWIRSKSVHDAFCVPLGGHIFEVLESSNSLLIWKYVEDHCGWEGRVLWKIATGPEGRYGDVNRLFSTNWIIRIGDFKIGKGSWMTGWYPTIPPVAFIVVPYWIIVLPLTVISSYLLLAKPRQSNQKKIPEPIPTEGA